ncbi:helix-turn-helix domain-containing protein, partial [Streptomyces alkaliphilus]
MTHGTDEHIGARVRVARIQAGYTQAVMAGLLGRSESWIQDLESGRLHLDRFSVINRVAELTDVDVVWLLGQPYRLDATSRTSPHRHIPALRAALRRAGLVLSGHPGLSPAAQRATAVTMQERARRAAVARQAADLPATVVDLPALVEDLTTSLLTETGTQREDALRLVVDVARTVRMALNALGYP